MTETFERWGRRSTLYDRYTTSAAKLLRSDVAFREAEAEWTAFFERSHGELFETLDLESPRETVFLDSLYYDFVVDRLLAFAERRFGFRLRNRAASANTDAPAFDFRRLHEAVVDDADLRGRLRDRLRPEHLRAADVASLRALYEGVVSREVRLALGEYYTPKGLAALGVEELAVTDAAEETFLDPGCGAGAFLSACIEAKRAALADDRDPAATLRTITGTVYGMDLNPVAVKSAKLSYVLSLLPVLDRAEDPELEVPVFLADSLGLTRDHSLTFRGEPFEPTVDHLVGNPPWITWNNLLTAVRTAWRERYVDRLDLLPQDGIESRLGHGNDDVSILFAWVCMHRYLEAGGDASFVLKRAIMKGPAGELLRTQRLDGRPVAVRRVNDFNALRPFGDGVDASAALYTFAADADPSFPIAARSWTRDGTAPEYGSLDAMETTLAREEVGLVPVDEDDRSSPWLRADADRRALGACDHRIRHGVKDDATDVYTIERDQLDALEPDLVYPYIKSRHVVKYGLFGHGLHLVPMRKADADNEAELRAEYPETYAYLDRHRDRLEARSSSWLDRGPFYSVFGLGDYTWSAYKVVWCRLGFKPHFAVVSTVEDEDLGEKPVVPGDHFMFVATDDEYEAHFLCALLNSASYQQSIRAVASEGKASLSKAVISELDLPRYRATERSERLAELSMAAHETVPEHTDVSKREYNSRTIEELAAVQAEIDELVEAMLAEGSVSDALDRESASGS